MEELAILKDICGIVMVWQGKKSNNVNSSGVQSFPEGHKFIAIHARDLMVKISCVNEEPRWQIKMSWWLGDRTCDEGCTLVIQKLC
jgi:hypothetical protein